MTDPANPMSAAQRLARQELPKRFYETAAAEARDGAFVVALDGRPARTPGKKLLAVPSLGLAEALAAEWDAAGERIDPGKMPLTRIVNSAIDHVAGAMPAVAAEIVKYAGTDLICYRADAPQGLIAAQEAAWSPLVAWAKHALGAHLTLVEGVIHAAQDRDAIAAIGKSVSAFDALGLAALSTATTLTGSAVIALALARGRIDADAAWAAAHVDEDWQMSQWGRDEVALARRAERRKELDAAAMILATASV